MALTGVLVGLAIATVVLLLATMNLIVAVLSVGAAACVETKKAILGGTELCTAPLLRRAAPLALGSSAHQQAEPAPMRSHAAVPT